MGNRLYVGNLSFGTTQAAIEAAFAAAGEVREVAMPTDRETGQPRGFAFVTMGTAQAATAAISQMNGVMLDGRNIKVNEAAQGVPRAVVAAAAAAVADTVAADATVTEGKTVRPVASAARLPPTGRAPSNQEVVHEP